MLTKMNTYQTKTPEPLEPQHSSEKQFLAFHNLGLYQYIRKTRIPNSHNNASCKFHLNWSWRAGEEDF